MTDIMYYSNKSKPCALIIQEIEKLPYIRTKLQFVNVDTTNPKHQISCVPAVIMENQMYQGKQVFEWLEKEKHDNTLPPYEVGFGTNNFSSLNDENGGQAENNTNFTYLNDPMSNVKGEGNKGPQKAKETKGGSKIEDSALDNLINQRKIDIPIQRQRN